MGPRILLVTTVHWPSAARLAGAFAGAGAEIAALFPPDHVIGKSRFVRQRHLYSPYFPQASLAAAVAEAQPDLIVPCDDRALEMLRTLHARTLKKSVAALIERSLGKIASYPVLTARSDFIASARAAGIAAPETIAVGNEDELDYALARLGTPAVLKSDGSWGGGGVAIVRSREAAREAFRRLSAPPSRARSLTRAVLRRDAHFLRDAIHPPRVAVCLQRFVPGRPATSAFACWKGRVLGTIHMDVLESRGATGPASVMRRSDCPQMEKAAVRIAERFGLSGLHGLDFVRDDRGQPHLIEINPRATQACAFALGPGHDLVAALAGCVWPGLKEWRRNPDSAWLDTAHLDVPWDDPAVLRACLKPGEAAPERRPEPLGQAWPLTVRQAVGR
jgi:hypothetical protein